MYDKYEIEEAKKKREGEFTKNDIDKDISPLSLKEAEDFIALEEEKRKKKFIDGLNRLSEETGYVLDLTVPQIYVRKKK